MDENQPINKKDKTQYGTGAQGTQEREQNVTGSVGVQNKQGQNINQGSTTGQKGGSGMGQQNQGNLQNQSRNPQGQEGRSQGFGPQNRPGQQNPQKDRQGQGLSQERDTEEEE